MAKRGVIFDMDGVLVDSYQAHFQSWQELGEKHGLELTPEQFAATFGKTTREMLKQFWSHAVSAEQIPVWDAEKEAFYREIIAASYPEIDGADTLVGSLHEAGFALAVGSSGPPENVEVVLDSLPSGSLFDVVVSGHHVEQGKPSPDIFLAAAEKLGLAPRSCVVVEDALVGIRAAREADMAVIALVGTSTREQLSEADLVVDRLDRLTPETFAELIDSRNGR